MNLLDPAPPVSGLIDETGLLVEADPRLLELNARAGGAIGAPLAIPQIAGLARLARRLRILVSRSVTVADGEDDVELWVRAQPQGGTVRLAITGWKFRDAWTPASEREAIAKFVTADADWLWETDAALRLTFVAEGAAVRHGFDAGDVLGQPLTQLFALEEASDGSLPILTAVAGHAPFEAQAANVRADGSPIVLSGGPRVDQAGRFAGFIGAVRPREVAARRPVADVPDTFGARLEQVLRAPLNRIVANADSINGQAGGPLRPEYTDYAADIANAGRHLLGLVDDLLDLQSIEQGALAIDSDTLDLADIARRAAGLLAVRAAAKQVRIDPPGEQDRLPATGDFRRVLQVLVNLIGNAVRYSPDAAMVWVRLEREGPVAAVIVADQGRGIAPEDQARIFEKFERADPAEPGGSGLGLYISRQLARAMGGDIVVDSAPGQGARFVFTLPAA